MVENMVQMEQSILLWIQEYLRFDFLTPIMVGITRLGDKGAIWIILSLLLLCFKKTRKTGVLCLISLALCGIVNNIFLKNLFARTRPYEVVPGLTRLIEAQKDFSFPSGHTGSSFAAATVMYMKLPNKYGIPAIALAFCISFSRLYLGVHYMSDVIGGALIGILIGVICVKFEHRSNEGIDIL